jgi:excisionase family DNA binding protein
MLQYYTLDEAAKVLGLPNDQTKKLLDEHKVRQYRDGRGGMRYVASAVDELARSYGRGSDPELQIGDLPRAKTGSTPPPSPADEGGTFDFSLTLEDSESEDVALGSSPLDNSASASSSKKAGAKSPPPKPGSDSDVRLVSDGSDLALHMGESDVKIVDDSSGPKSGKKQGTTTSGQSATPPPRSARPPARKDSEVRIVPFEEGGKSDVSVVGDAPASGVNLGATPVKKQSDSDIRLEEVGRRSGTGKSEGHVTEEIDLDADVRKVEKTGKSKVTRAKVKPGSGPIPLPTESPFEISSDDDSATGEKSTESSGDFELTPAGEDSLEVSSGELRALGVQPEDEEVSLGELSGPGVNQSGIGVGQPRDSGISLEGSESASDAFELSVDDSGPKTPSPSEVAEDSDSSEFELSLDDSGPKTPAPSEAADDSDSEFELSLDADSSGDQPVAPADDSDSSEFELTLDADASGESTAPAADDSDSEFELTLDESGGLAAVEEPAADADPDNIFETEFDVPALDEESGSEAVALEEGDTDLESSDFDLALDEADADAEGDESASQVVALEEEEEADAAARTVQRRTSADDDEEAAGGDDFGVISGEEEGDELAEVEEEEEAAPKRQLAPAPGAVAPPRPWGVLPAIVMIPCTIVMFLAGLMGLELLHGMWGYQQPTRVGGFLTDSLARSFGGDDALPKE